MWKLNLKLLEKKLRGGENGGLFNGYKVSVLCTLETNITMSVS